VTKNSRVFVGATDNNRSRRVINRIAVDSGRPAIFGRVFRRACGGDVIRVVPGGPCYECLFSGTEREEISSARSGQAPAYSDVPVVAEPGLALDIAPITALCTRLVIQELIRGRSSRLEMLDEDLCANFFVWANRREEQFSGWLPMRYGVNGQTVQRWYGAKAQRRPLCPVCDEEAFLAGLERSAGQEPLRDVDVGAA
jgi:molybdopterin/thiamine biosynthesis adenylyltransferase